MTDQMQTVPKFCTKAQRWRHFVLSLECDVTSPFHFILKPEVLMVLTQASKSEAEAGDGIAVFFDDQSWWIVNSNEQLGGRYVKFDGPPPDDWCDVC